MQNGRKKAVLSKVYQSKKEIKTAPRAFRLKISTEGGVKSETMRKKGDRPFTTLKRKKQQSELRKYLLRELVQDHCVHAGL